MKWNWMNFGVGVIDENILYCKCVNLFVVSCFYGNYFYWIYGWYRL